MKLLIAAAAGLVFCASAHADTTPAQEEAKQKSSRETVICKKQKPLTGTRLRRQEVCATQAQWAQIAEEARNATQDIQGQGKFNMDKGD